MTTADVIDLIGDELDDLLFDWQDSQLPLQGEEDLEGRLNRSLTASSISGIMVVGPWRTCMALD